MSAVVFPTYLEGEADVGAIQSAGSLQFMLMGVITL